MNPDLEEGRLDDVTALQAADPQQMLPAVASGAAQVRMGRTAAADAGLDGLARADRPRAIVVTGMGGSGIAGDVLAAVAGPNCPQPIWVHRGYGLPGWVGAADLVLAVSCSGATAETLSATDEAIRRGAQLIGVGGGSSPLHERCEQARAPFVVVGAQLAPRATLWGLVTPLLLVGSRLGLLDLGTDDSSLEAAAVRLEQVAEACRPDRDTFVNPAKTLALEMAGRLPMIWGAGQTGPVAALRLSCQLAENAKLPSSCAGLPEAHHNQSVALDGALAGASAEDDLFRDRVEEAPAWRLRLVLLHDDDGSASAGRRVEVSGGLAESRGVPVSLVRSEGSSTVERLASLIGLVDYASVYLALAQGIDPSPVAAIDELKAQLS